MKTSSILKIAALAMPLMLASCGSKKNVAEKLQQQSEANTTVENSQEATQVLGKVNTKMQAPAKFITSKVKFTVETGNQDITLTGNLKMKRDDVIRLQLMAFGFVEAARIEFTKEYVLIMDRINKQYIMVPYFQVDFLRNSGLNFYSLQALFWNELFLPNRANLTEEDMKKFNASSDSGDAIVSFEDEKMSYNWLVSEKDASIKMANIMYRSKYKAEDNAQVNWDYQNFQVVDKQQFPTDMHVTITTSEREVKVGLKLSYLGNESEWETRTEVSNKYREVKIDEMLKRFMSL